MPFFDAFMPEMPVKCGYVYVIRTNYFAAINEEP